MLALGAPTPCQAGRKGFNHAYPRTYQVPGQPKRHNWPSLVVNAIDYTEHMGQIAYLRGMLKGAWVELRLT